MSKPPTLRVNEVFWSIQGESTRAGLPCLFIRLTGCHLRCSYCDTEYAFHEGGRMSLDAIIERANAVAGGPWDLVELTGGEPLLQPHANTLMTMLADLGKTVLVETSGASPIDKLDPRIIRIMDLKTPGSGECDRNLLANLDHLNERDEIKFVLTSRADYEWARTMIRDHRLVERVHAILMSPVAAMKPGLEIAGTPGLAIADLAAWILEDHLPVRLQSQLHKLIWDPNARGV
ncbi:radical SAM protein [Mucisphaera calidilacus]|uniref:7-carboxy-7-deazaguanine synthase n=1 Tax=Mucisphaera calidilacus TaxID=2527982 RepID=A0A518BYW6_9BACT|nr:radical SAM protein [Mucisphaera calidilacus]QDU72154.1 7-carboxy-7-deazaguanine synthase [Mucisphaera calidilacus]